MTPDKLEQLTRAQLWHWAGIIQGTPRLSNTLVPSIEIETPEGMAAFDFPDYPTGDNTNVLGGARLILGYSLIRTELQIRALALAALNNGETDLAKAIMTLENIHADVLDEAVRHLNNNRAAQVWLLMGLTPPSKEQPK